MKKALSVLLAVMMLLGCSVTAFAFEMKEPCDYCQEGEAVRHIESEALNGEQCPDCGSYDIECSAHWYEYICDSCDKLAYKIFNYYQVLCYGDCKGNVSSNPPCLSYYYEINTFGWDLD